MRSTTRFSVLSAASLLLAQIAQVHSFTSYANDFLDPKKIVGVEFPNITIDAQETILEWASELAAEGPWCTFFVSVYP